MPAPQPARSTDGLAIAALVLAILAIVPVAVVLAIVALGRIRRTGAGGRGLAIAALVVSAVWAVIGVVVAVLLIVFGDEIVDSIETELAYSDDISDTSVGDCIDFQPGLFDELGELQSVEPFLRIVDCSGEHEEEVISLFELSGDDFPGQSSVDAQVGERCTADFEDYIGLPYEESRFDITFFAPSEDSWGRGDRQVMCSVYDPSGPVTELMRGSAQ